MKKFSLKSLFLSALFVLGVTSAWAGDKTVVKYSFDDASSPAVTAGSRVSLDYTRTSVITNTKFLNAWNNANGDPGASTISLGDTDLSAETWTLSFDWAAVGGCNSKADHTTLKAGDTNLFDLTGNSNWNTTVTITYAGSDGTKTLPVPGCDKGKRFTAGTGDQLNTTAYWHHIVVTGSASGVTMTITNSSTGTAVVENVMLSETNVNPTSLIIEPCCGGAIGIDELSLTYYVEGEVIQTPMAAYTAVDGINRTITATCDTEGATLYYSLDNENWTEGASVTVSASGNVYFKAVKGSSESDVLTFAAEAGTEIVLNTPAIVRNANGIVTISADQSKLLLSPEATIYYTYGEENGSFTGSKELTVAADATITAYAEAEGYATSLTATRAVALFPEQVDTLFSAAAATKGWSANAFSNETITASERTYATLLLDEAAWSENVLFQTDGAWGLRASGNWYINSNTDNSWLLVKNGKAGNIVIVDATFAPAETVNATYAEKYSFGSKHAYTIDADGNAELALIKASANEMDYFYGVYGYSLTTQDDPATDALAAAKEALQTAIAIATNINPEGLADAITAAQAALNAENATVESIAQAAQTLEAAIKAYFGEVLPRLGAIVQALNDSTLNAAYANAQAALAKEGVTPQELAAAMQQIITTAQQVAPAHLQNLRVYAAKYGTADAVTIVDNALAAITSGNVSQIIATMAAVNEVATPIAQQVLGGIISYVRAFGLTEQAAQAQAALESGNYITMITVAKALYTHLIAAAKDYLPKLAIIAEGLNDSTLNAAYAEAQALFVNEEDITPEDLGAAMQKIIVAAKEVAPAHLQNLRGYALKYGQEGTAALVDSALVAINEGNVSKIIATMTAVKEAATPLATNILQQMIGYAQSYAGFEEDVTAAQAALRGGNYITMITTAKALYAKLIAAANAYVASVKEIPTEGKEGVDDLNAAILAAEQALEAQDADFSKINTAISNLVAAVAAFKAANQPPFDPATVIVNAEFNPEADPLGWEKVNSAQYYDLGMGLIGTYQVRGEHSAATVDETHLATEFAAGLECRWNTNYAAFTQTTAELPAGSYKLSFDVENTNATTTQANYENRFFVKVGETTYNDESTEWMNGKSAWTTHAITFTLTEASPITISLGYGTGSNNFGVGNTPALFVSHMKLEAISALEFALVELKAAIEAANAKAATYTIGEVLFTYPASEIAPLNDAITTAQAAYDAAESAEAVKAATATLNAFVATFAPTMTVPVAEQPYYIANTTATGNLCITTEKVSVAKNAYVYFTEVEGGYILSNKNGEYILKTADNNWTLSTTTNKDEAYVVNFKLTDDAYTIEGAKGLFGLDNAEEGSTVYANKSAANYGLWTIAEAVVITPAYGTIWENGETTTEEDNTIITLTSEYFNDLAQTGDTIRIDMANVAQSRAARIVKKGELTVKTSEGEVLFENNELKATDTCVDIVLDEASIEKIAAAENVQFIYKNLTVTKISLLEKESPVVGIASVKSGIKNGAIYNMQGQKVEKLGKGIFIINGKKTVVK